MPRSLHAYSGGEREPTYRVLERAADALKSPAFVEHVRDAIGRVVGAAVDRAAVDRLVEEAVVHVPRIVSSDDVHATLGRARTAVADRRITIDSILGNKRHRRGLIDGYRSALAAHTSFSQNRIDMQLNALRGATARAIERTLYDHAPHLRTPVRDRALELARSPALSGRDAVRIARASGAVAPHELRALVDAVEELPAPVLIDRQDADAGTVRSDLQRAVLRRLATASTEEDPSADLEALRSCVAVLGRILASPSVAYAFPRTGADRLVERLHELLRAREATLRIITCPDYSVEHIESHGKRLARFTFERLGEGEGVVARKGYDFVAAVAAALEPELDVLRVEHILPSFEFDAERGFAGKGESVPYDECLERLRRSLGAIEEAYAARGLAVTTRLSAGIIPDAAFHAEADAHADAIRERAATDMPTRRLLHEIFRARKTLYAEWHPPRAGEVMETYRERAIREIVPRQAAEYVTIGARIAREPGTLLLSTDSSVMTELYALLADAPYLYGESRSEESYVGA